MVLAFCFQNARQTGTWAAYSIARTHTAISCLKGDITPAVLKSKYEERFKALYSKSIAKINDLSADEFINKRNVFTNMELSLKYTSVYGFDFDYTLVQYTQEVLTLIYDLAKKKMVEGLLYPTPIKTLQYDPDFAIRGLHLDISNGLLMKMDANHHIQLGSVYRGKTPIPRDHITSIYGGVHIPLNIIDDHIHALGGGASSSRKLIQFLDWFSIPEIALFADISEYFYRHSIPFDPEYLYKDVKYTMRNAHLSGEIHSIITNNPDQFIDDSSTTSWEYLLRLKEKGKKLFILTNSPFGFVKKGMKFITKMDDWADLFDVIVCSARKPDFYDDDINRPFRLLNSSRETISWELVKSLEQGSIYNQGNIKEFVNLTGWRGSQVLYIGDHVYSDLSNPNLHLGWNTVAIIPELNDEIEKGNSRDYKEGLAKLLALEGLLNHVQGDHLSVEVLDLIEEWKRERNDLRKYLKNVSNPYFGSIFRTERGPTYFSRRLMRFASLYTSSLSNFLQYSTNHTFYSRRSALPHEPDIRFIS